MKKDKSSAKRSAQRHRGASRKAASSSGSSDRSAGKSVSAAAASKPRGKRRMTLSGAVAQSATPASVPMRLRREMVRVGLTQMACSDDPERNLRRQVELLNEAAGQGARLLCTPELFRTQYFCQVEDHRFFNLAEPIPGPTTDAIGKIARRHKAVIVASIFERRARGLYHNTAAIIESDGSIAGVYRKMHIPDDPLYYEKFYFSPGDCGFVSLKTSQGNIGTLICWDQWFPEAARATVLAGADILFYPTAIGWHPSEKSQYGRQQREAWELMQRSHAMANGCFVCAPNRVGHELIADISGKPVNPEGIEFWGGSFVASPDGQVAARASEDKEQVLVVDLDLSQIEFHRTHWPFLRDRRIDAYAPLLDRYSDAQEK